MDAFDIIRVLKARQNKLLEQLPPDLLNEFLEIEIGITQLVFGRTAAARGGRA